MFKSTKVSTKYSESVKSKGTHYYQNSTFRSYISLFYILHYLIIITDALTCEQHFNVVAYLSGADFNYFIQYWVV